MTVRKETIVIEVRADGTRIVTRKLGGIDTSARKADKSVRRLAKSSNVLRNSLIGVGSLLQPGPVASASLRIERNFNISNTRPS